MEPTSKNVTLFNSRALLASYRLYWPWVLFCVMLCGGLGFLAIKCTVPKVEIAGQILISDENSSKASSLGTLAGMFGGGAFGSNRSVEDEMVVVTAHSVLRKVVVELDMNVIYEYRRNLLKKITTYTQPPVKLVYDKAIADTLGAILTFNVKVDDAGRASVEVRGLKDKVIAEVEDVTLPATVTTPYGTFGVEAGPVYEPGKSVNEKISFMSYDAAALGLSRVVVGGLAEKRTDIILLSYITSDPAFGKRVINSIIDNFNNTTVAQKQDFNDKTLAFLNERISTLSNELNLSEAQVEAFMTNRQLVNPESQAGLFLGRHNAQEIELIKSQNNHELMGMAIDFLKEEANNTSLLPVIPSIESLSPLIQNYNSLILQRIAIAPSAKNGNIALQALDTRIAAVRDNLMAALNKQYETSTFEISELQKQFSKSKSKLAATPGIEREYTSIMRQQTLKEQLYMYLLRQREETEMAIAGAHPRGVVIDQAYVSRTDIGLSSKIVLLACLIVGLLLPAVIFTIYWHFSRKVVYRGQAAEMSGIPVIAELLPADEVAQPVVLKDPTSVAADRYCILRSNILSLDLPADKRVISVSSTGNDTAESASVAYNLAASIAATGRNTVLVNANPYDTTLATLVAANKIAGLEVETIGHDAADAIHYLASVAFAEKIDNLASSGHYIILLTPDLSRFSLIEPLVSHASVQLAAVQPRVALKSDIRHLEALMAYSSHTFILSIG